MSPLPPASGAVNLHKGTGAFLLGCCLCLSGVPNFEKTSCHAHGPKLKETLHPVNVLFYLQTEVTIHCFCKDGCLSPTAQHLPRGLNSIIVHSLLVVPGTHDKLYRATLLSSEAEASRLPSVCHATLHTCAQALCSCDTWHLLAYAALSPCNLNTCRRTLTAVFVWQASILCNS